MASGGDGLTGGQRDSDIVRTINDGLCSTVIGATNNKVSALGARNRACLSYDTRGNDFAETALILETVALVNFFPMKECFLLG